MIARNGRHMYLKKQNNATIIFVIVLFAAVLVLSACSNQSGGTTKVDEDYRRGTGSLSVSFVRDTPPSKLVEGEESTVLLNIANQGAYDISNGRVVLTMDESVLAFGSRDSYGAGKESEVLAQSESRPFRGLSVEYPKGEQRLFNFPVYALPLPQESQERAIDIIATACYTYQTFQKAMVCMDFDPYNLKTQGAKQKKPCDAQDVSMQTGGGPINVGQVTTRFNSQDGLLTPVFSFTLTSSSQALIFAPGQEQVLCSQLSGTSKEKIRNVIHFKAYLSDQQLKCNKGYTEQPDGSYVLQMADGIAKIICEADPVGEMANGATDNYMAPLTTNISYGLVTSTSTSVKVVRQIGR